MDVLGRAGLIPWHPEWHQSEEGKCPCTPGMIQMCSEYIKWPKMMNCKGSPLYLFIYVGIVSRNSLLALRGP